MKDGTTSGIMANFRRVLFSSYARNAFFSYYVGNLKILGVDSTVVKEWGYLTGPKNLLEPDIIESTERPVLNLIRELHLSGLCIDVGAWIGYYSLLLARDARKVIALEPDPRNIKYLRHNLIVNKVNNVRILPFALDTKDGDADLVLAPMSSGNSLHASGYTRKVKTIRLETLLADLCEREIDLIKMDVEGAEFSIINNLDKSVFYPVNKWLIECHKKGAPQRQLQAIFETNGYGVEWLRDNNNGLTDHIYAVKK